jgi:hypothetical protein
MPGVVPPAWTSKTGVLQWDGPIGNAKVGTPMLIGTHPKASPDGIPDHADPPFGPPPNYRTIPPSMS